MHSVETVLWLLVAMLVLGTVAQRISIPYPIVLVLGGTVIGLIDIFPNVELEPDLVFLLFLPPALFMAAAGTDWRGFRRDLVPIVELAVNLVLTTTAGIAIVAMLVISGLHWSTAFVIGAIVAPPDAVATVSILRAMPVPRRVVTILEGESLLNDSTALVAYRFAVAAVVSGSFSLWHAGLDFIWVALGGLAIGTIIASAATWFIAAFVEETSIIMMATLLIPIAAYMAAEEAQASGVLAVVAAGLLFSRFSMLRLSVEARLQVVNISSFASWLLDGLVFILIGLQLPAVIDGLGDHSRQTLAWYGVVIAFAVIAIRMIWVRIAFSDRPDRAERSGEFRRRRGRPSLGLSTSKRLVIGWAGPRGVVTLATALALPYTTNDGSPFPERNLIIFLAFCVILATLVGQGLTLPWLIRRLNFPPETEEADERNRARQAAAIAALATIDAFVENADLSPQVADSLRGPYKRMAAIAHANDPDPGTQRSVEVRQMFQQILSAQRTAVRDLNIQGEISDSVRREIEHALDLQETARPPR